MTTLPSSLLHSKTGMPIRTPIGNFIPIFCASCAVPCGTVLEDMVSVESGYVCWLCNDCWPKFGVELGLLIQSDDTFKREQALEIARRKKTLEVR